MIFIDPEDVIAHVPPNLLVESQQATSMIYNCRPADRATLLKTKAPVWQALKAVLSALSNGKCWYCETQDDRSDNVIDHFRPKGRLAEDKQHEGYWWLAFTPGNLRFSCTFCNSRRVDVVGGTEGGKQDHFPLLNDETRARVPSDPITAEQPELLDPCCAADVMQLWYDETGQAKVNPRAEVNYPSAKVRVSTSVHLYHLDHAKSTGARRRKQLKVQRLCDQGDRFYDRMVAGDDVARQTFFEVCDQLFRLVNPRADYSAAAKCAVRGYRETSVTAYAVSQSM